MRNDDAARILEEVSGGLAGWRDLARRLGMSAADVAVYATVLPKVK